MEHSDLNDFLIDNFVGDDILQDLIKKEISIQKLCFYLKLKDKRIQKNISKRSDFSITKILENNEGKISLKKEALGLAISVQCTNNEFIQCLKWFNSEIKTFLQGSGSEQRLLELYCISEVLINLKVVIDISTYISINELKKFLLKLTDKRPNAELYANIYDTFMKYFDEIILNNNSFIGETLTYLIQNKNADFLCVIFNRKLTEIVNSEVLENRELWNLIKCYLIEGNSVKKKQALYILMKTLEFLKDNGLSPPEILKSDSFEVWDLYFLLLNISKEKQLHLIQPALKLLPSIENLDMTWKLSLYKILLSHSQLFVVYKTINYLLTLKFDADNIHRELMKNILIALNKYECSDLTQNTYLELSSFCTKLDTKCIEIFFEEFLNIDWNPAAAWSILKKSKAILPQISYNYIRKMLRILRNLPHPFIRSSCILFFLQNVLEGFSDDFMSVLIEIGKILLFTESKIDTEIFEKIVVSNKEKFKDKSDQLKKETLKAIDGNNEELTLIYFKLLKILDITINFDDINFQQSIIGDLIIMFNIKQFGAVKITEYLLERTKNVQNNHYKYLGKIPDVFLNKFDTITENEWEKIEILLKSTEVGLDDISYNMLMKKFGSPHLVKQFIEALYVRNKWWIITFKYSFHNNHNIEKNSTIVDKFEKLLSTEDDQMFFLVIENLNLLVEYKPRELSDTAFIYDKCLRKIPDLPNILLRTYSVILFKTTLHQNLLCKENFIEYFENWWTEMFIENFSAYDKMIIMMKFRELILIHAPNVDLFLPLWLTALLQYAVVQKIERVEYGICQDIHHYIPKFSSIENPNIVAMNLKMLAIESMYLLGKTNESIPDRIVYMLLDLYQKHYGKRYFPESKIHLEKLRIIQTLIILVHSISQSKDKLVQFILNSFCEETHQHSIKQLLQWLLIILMSSDVSEHLNFLIDKINLVSLSQPSSVVFLIPVMYHLLLSSKNVKHWFEATDALLSWTMGANFKLRVYSQVMLKRLFEKAEEQQLTAYISKYNFLLKPISKVLEATGNAAEDILKSDLDLIEKFNPIRHYSVENIFVTLPKIDTPHSEWENTMEYEFSKQFDIKIRSDGDFPIVYQTTVNGLESTMDSTGMNLQKKIIPWKYVVEESANESALGDLICVASLLEKPSNLGGLSRTCEVFSVNQLAIHNIKIKDDKEFKNLSMSSENWVKFMEVKREDLSNYLTRMKEFGYSIIGLEQTFESVKINDHKFGRKTVLLLGNEKEGIPAPLLSLMDKCVEIPQFGQTRSLNVHVAAATCIWEYVRQHFLPS